jgi:prophage antirepressor-like protein
MPDEIQVRSLTTTEFAFDDTVFTVDCTDPNEPRFSLPEVCKFLGYTNATRAATSYVDQEDQSYATIPSASGPQRTRMVNEPGLYALIFGSSHAKARDFRRKVFKEILPSIRKTGEYQTKAHKLALAKGQALNYFSAVGERIHKLRSTAECNALKAMVLDFQNATGIPQTLLTEHLESIEAKNFIVNCKE